MDATDKVAVVRIAGVLMDGTTGYPLHQIERAAKDPAVKAVVVRINSPGGTITASEDLHRASDPTARQYAPALPGDRRRSR